MSDNTIWLVEYHTGPENKGWWIPLERIFRTRKVARVYAKGYYQKGMPYYSTKVRVSKYVLTR